MRPGSLIQDSISVFANLNESFFNMNSANKTNYHKFGLVRLSSCLRFGGRWSGAWEAPRPATRSLAGEAEISWCVCITSSVGVGYNVDYDDCSHSAAGGSDRLE